jgi:hypothetical protein
MLKDILRIIDCAVSLCDDPVQMGVVDVARQGEG